MIIRKMTIADYDSVYDLWLNTPGMGLNNMDDSKQGLKNSCGGILRHVLSLKRITGLSV